MFKSFNFSASAQNVKQTDRWWMPALLATAILLNVCTAFHYFSSTALDFDASHYYLPYARQLLSDGLRFFADPQSVRYPPLAYVYPAIFGANQIAVKIGNIVLSCALLGMLFRTGSLLHSRQAGIFAAFLFALSPLFRDMIPRVLTEPVFLFLVGAWLLCVSEIIINHRYRLAVVGGIAFGLAVLARGSFYYFVYVAIVFAAGMMLRSQGDARRMWASILALHSIALIFPVIFIIKNWLLFDFPFFATGTGNALYFGSHPLVNGYELPYYGLGYDEGAITGETDHLSIAGDRLLKGVALTMLAERPWPDLFAAYLQKTGAFIFVTKAVLADSIWNIRSLRIAEVMLSIIGLLAIRPRLLQLLVAGALTYQIAVHVPLLYSHRYSIGAIDLWLVLLTGIGIAALLQSRKPRMIAGMTALILAGVVAGELHRKYSSPLSPEIDKVPHEVIWRKPGGDITPMGTSTFTLIEPGKFRLTAEPNALDIPVRVPRLTSDGNYVLSLKMAIRAESQTNCRKMRVLYKRLVDPGFTDFQSIRLRVPADGEMHDYHLGATLPLALIANGDIRLSLECPAGTTVSIDEISIAEPKVATAYKLLYLKRLADNAHP